MRWRPRGARFAWSRPLLAPGARAPEAADLRPLLDAAARWGSKAPPALLAAHWMGQQQARGAAGAHAGADSAGPQLPEAYRPYSAAAAPGRFEAFLAAVAESLSYLEGEMQAVGGCNPAIAKPWLPLLRAVAAAAAAAPAAPRAAAEARAAVAREWAALESPAGLARAALEAVRLDRGSALADWLGDACR